MLVIKQLMVPIDFHSISFPTIDEVQQLFVQKKILLTFPLGYENVIIWMFFKTSMIFDITK